MRKKTVRIVVSALFVSGFLLPQLLDAGQDEHQHAQQELQQQHSENPLLEEMSMHWDGPAAAMLGVMNGGNPESKMWADSITENPNVGDTEVWEFYNFTADAHPMHIHEIVFEVVNREGLVLDEFDEPVRPVQLSGNVRLPEAWESGYKDTVISYPGEVTRLRAKFDTPGTFVWHCHIVDHEDNEMMRPYRIGPEDPAAPGGSM